MVMMDNPPQQATSSSTSTISSSSTSSTTTLSSSHGGAASSTTGISRIASALKRTKSSRSSITWSKGTGEAPPNDQASTVETPRSMAGRRPTGPPPSSSRRDAIGSSSASASPSASSAMAVGGDKLSPSAPSSPSPLSRGSRVEGKEGGGHTREGSDGAPPPPLGGVMPLTAGGSLRGLTSKSKRRSLQLSLSASGPNVLPSQPKNGMVTPAMGGGGGSILGTFDVLFRPASTPGFLVDMMMTAHPASVSGSRLSGFPQCPLQPDLDLLHKFRAKEHEYARERNGAATPFQFIDRSNQKRSSLDSLDWDDSSDDDFEDFLAAEAGSANPTTKNPARVLIHYRPRQIQPTKLAEELTRNYKKWHAEMTLKLEAKKAESKRKGNRNDFSLSTTPREKKKKESFRKSSPSEKAESSPRQANRQTKTDASASPRKSVRDKRDSKPGDGWVKPTTRTSSTLPSPKRQVGQEPLRGAPVRQPEDDDGEPARQGKAKYARSLGRKTSLSVGTGSVESSTDKKEEGKTDTTETKGITGGGSARLSSASKPVLADSTSSGSSSSVLGNGVLSSSQQTATNGEDANGKRGSGNINERLRDFDDSPPHEADEKENASGKERESFLSSLKSIRKSVSVKRKSATTSDLMAIVNPHNSGSSENGGAESEPSSGSQSTRERRERSESAKVKREKSFGRLSEWAGMVTAIGKDRDKDRDRDKEQVVNKTDNHHVHQTTAKDGRKNIKKGKRKDSEHKS